MLEFESVILTRGCSRSGMAMRFTSQSCLIYWVDGKLSLFSSGMLGTTRHEVFNGFDKTSDEGVAALRVFEQAAAWAAKHQTKPN